MILKNLEKCGPIYLACPYSGTISEMESRFQAVTRAAAMLMALGARVISPVTHGHVIDRSLPEVLPQSWNFWRQQCIWLVNVSSALLVLKENGWSASEGVAAEIDAATSIGIDVHYVTLHEIESAYREVYT